ncbi:proline--tRNA ligase [Puniceicoccus vermicola]|uniref:Proline--tRNA ligase n=1 Tax=Puniceicoccus vermicola TaxID=388746 RepID=A0A7X1E3G0_9BACT|nr:proline--tRNA ligase [Puniceicoccus vermicola]MBC2600948.1 proline--tRNA ligase [Puniceicoccus vermicola]
MAKKQRTAIEPTRAENYPEWYQQVIKAADLAENSPVRGCMVIKPWGYGLWENIQKVLDRMFKETGHENAYFPLFIPRSFLQKEAEHVDGFAKECAVVTHSRLEADENGVLQPTGELEEPLIVRPTSETIIGEMYSKWVQSYRDLPILINQWANVVRWEMRTRLFLRTAEFLWQEGHTVHATQEEAVEETLKMLDVYETFARDYLAVPVIKGEKTAAERFPGAVSTYSIEAMMQDRKALQAGTSHFLGQNFAKSSEIKFLSSEGQEEYAWTTSWGVSTRLVGAMIMVHSDDDGLVLPPKLAPRHVVIIPVIPKEEHRDAVTDYCRKLQGELLGCNYGDQPLRVELDERDMRGGEKVWGWVKKGVPVRLEVGPRDVENDAVFLGRRDKAAKDRQTVSRKDLLQSIEGILGDIHEALYQRALKFQKENTKRIETKEEFYSWFANEKESGFVICPWAGSAELEKEISTETKVTIRCIPMDEKKTGTCPFTGTENAPMAVFARSY